jgi:hypothetical protein
MAEPERSSSLLVAAIKLATVPDVVAHLGYWHHWLTKLGFPVQPVSPFLYRRTGQECDGGIAAWCLSNIISKTPGLASISAFRVK